MGIKALAGAGLAAVGTVYAMGKLSGMDSDDIREKGESVTEALRDIGSKFTNSEIATDIRERVSSFPYIGQVLDVAGKTADMGLNGFDKFVDVIADAKEHSELDGSDFAQNVSQGITGSLKDLVATGMDFATEKLGFPRTADTEQASQEPEYDQPADDVGYDIC